MNPTLNTYTNYHEFVPLSLKIRILGVNSRMLSRLSIVLAVFAVYHTAPALADAVEIGTFQSWSAYSSSNRGQEMCYISSRPVNVDGKNTKNVFAEVTHRPVEHHNNVIDILGGYNFKPDLDATLQIGKATFNLFTHGAAAFAKGDDDLKIVEAMRKADTMTFSGTDKKGNVSKATFTLKGMEQAYEAISKSCKVEISGAPAAAKKKKKS